MLFYEKEDQCATEERIFDLLRTSQLNQTAWSTALQKNMSLSQRNVFSEPLLPASNPQAFLKLPTKEGKPKKYKKS